MISRTTLDLFLRRSAKATVEDRFGDSGYKLSVPVPESNDPGRRASILVSNDVNPIMLQMFCPIDSGSLDAALQATSKIGVVGVGTMGEDNLALRHGVFMEWSDGPAITNAITALAMAYGAYLDHGGR